jgi:hypothetical protein
MTDAEWLACEDPRPMMEILAARASRRRQWLFSCACCRAVWPMLPSLCREAVELVERFADGEVVEDDLVVAFHELYPQEVASPSPGGVQAVKAVGQLGWRWRWRNQDGSPWPGGFYNGDRPPDAVARSAAESLAKTIPWREARRRQSDLLREVMRNPDGERAPIDPGWLRWNGGAVRALAASIYHDRAFDHLPILADALEDAGCADAALLGHCRGAGPHLRGCWAIDAILGQA